MSKTLFTLLAGFLSSFNGLSQWSSCGNATFEGNSPKTMIVHNDTLIIGGGFNKINGILVNGLATWNGNSWSDIPTTDGCQAAIEYGDSLIISGGFNDQGNVPGCNAIAAFYNGEWLTMGGGIEIITGEIRGLAIDTDGDLLAVGGFGEISDLDQIQGVAKWDGVQWEDIGGVQGFIGEAECATTFFGDVYVGGAFAFANETVQSPNLAHWDGAQWIPVETGTSGMVREIFPCEEHGFMYIGGLFGLAGGEPAIGVAKFDGVNASPISDVGFNNAALAICVYRDQIYAGGAFTALSTGEEMLGISRFDGVHWQPVGGGIGLGLFDMIVYQDELYVAGGLQWAGSEDFHVEGVARWYLHPDSVTWGVPDHIPNFEEKVERLKIFPNPTDGQITIEFQKSFDILLVFDQLGNLQAAFSNKNNNSFDLKSFAQGVYQLVTVTQGVYTGQAQLVIR